VFLPGIFHKTRLSFNAHILNPYIIPIYPSPNVLIRNRPVCTSYAAPAMKHAGNRRRSQGRLIRFVAASRAKRPTGGNHGLIGTPRYV
jgi:hypothetical protein